MFLFPRLQRLFPDAKFIGIARDPRDVPTSAWHMVHRPSPGEDERTAKLGFIRMALPSIGRGARAMLEMARRGRGRTADIPFLRKGVVGTGAPR